MSLIQSIDLARSDRIGPHGADTAALDGMLAKAEAALDWVRTRYEDKTLPVLRYAGRHDDIPALRDVAPARA